MFDFKDRVVLVTGAAGNVGQALTSAFQTAGAKMVLVDHSPDRLAQMYSSAINDSRVYLAQAVDVTSPVDVDRTVETALERFGRIDVLVNAAGGYRGGTKLHETALESFDLMFNLNAKSVFVCSRAVAPVMIRQAAGRIINIASKSALYGGPTVAAYSASKAAVQRLTESLAEELKEFAINVNCVLPSIIDTPANRQAMPKADFSKWVTPANVVDAIVFLASDSASAITGASIPIYGRLN